MINKFSCAVVIPVYKSQLNEFEQTALAQALKVLKAHDLIFVVPAGLTASYLKHGKCEFFPASYFKGVESYNDLMVSAAFYRRFLTYRYILIYQLDAYVFRDELTYWCTRGYSYIGAPWINASFYARKTKDYAKYGLRYPEVGNGGFSLRSTRMHYWACIFYFTYVLRVVFKSLNEDWFWVNIIGRINPFYKIADAEIAMKFAIESNPRQSLADLNGNLPFGCHGWDKYFEEFWINYIPLLESKREL